MSAKDHSIVPFCADLVKNPSACNGALNRNTASSLCIVHLLIYPEVPFHFNSTGHAGVVTNYQRLRKNGSKFAFALHKRKMKRGIGTSIYVRSPKGE